MFRSAPHSRSCHAARTVSSPPDIAQQFRDAAAASPDNSLPVNEGFIRHVLMAGEDEEMIGMEIARDLE